MLLVAFPGLVWLRWRGLERRGMRGVFVGLVVKSWRWRSLKGLMRELLESLLRARERKG